MHKRLDQAYYSEDEEDEEQDDDMEAEEDIDDNMITDAKVTGKCKIDGDTKGYIRVLNRLALMDDHVLKVWVTLPKE